MSCSTEKLNYSTLEDMNVTKAIIPVAGWGTRRLPITKVIEKCMLPIGNRPLVDYVVQDCIAAGINDIYFVVGEQSSQLRDYYRSNIPLNDYLRENGKAEKLALIAPLEDVKIHFIIQSSQGKYGTAVPVALAAEFIEEGESAVVLMGDDFIYNKDGSSEVQHLLDSTPAGNCGLIAVEASHEDISRYGVIEQDGEGNYVRMVEKPSPENAPSNLINPSKYLLTKEVIDRCKNVKASDNGEFYIIDAINDYVAEGGTMKVVAARGEYLDGGNVDGWLHANNVVVGA